MATRRKVKRTPGTKRTASRPVVRVRMYRQGLGDCFLLTFHTGPQPVNVLIDFGSIGEQTTGVSLKDVAADIVQETGKHLHLLIATHEHQDHVNGFLKQQAALAPPFKVDRVWLAWTEDAADQLAQDIKKYRADLLTSLAAASNALAARFGPSDPTRIGVESVLSFVGDVPVGGAPFAAKKFAKSVDESMDWVTTRASNADKFLQPGMVIEPKWLPGIRIYVLGPPRDKAKINSLGRHGDTELYELARAVGAGLAACAEFSASNEAFPARRGRLEGDDRAAFERHLPFDPRFRVETADDAAFRKRFADYYDPENAWRRIDTDWLAASADLALQLDNSTNNTSLVLAIEVIADGRVLLFPGDAQLGNWLSWHDYTFKVKEGDGSPREVKAADLLARTVLYKVGHHSSHNATLRGHGLELMQRDDLVALIPLDSQTASHKWPTASWPAEGVYAALCERAKGRVLRSDTGWPAASDRPHTVPKQQWDDIRKNAEATGMIVVNPQCVDYHLPA